MRMRQCRHATLCNSLSDRLAYHSNAFRVLSLLMRRAH